VATGDLLAHTAVNEAARSYAKGDGYDYRPMLAAVRPRISAADLAICHVETPLSATDTHVSGYPVFNSPHEIADADRWAGYDGCSTASNHALDGGFAGVTSTLDMLDRAGLRHAGTARTAREAAQSTIYPVRGVRIAHLSYTYGANGIPVPSQAPWSLDVTSVPAILAAARRAKAAGAQFVMVSMHWGIEYQVTPTAEQVAQAKALLASPDVDLIIGDHVHVQQPVERVGGKYVIYGLGNLLSNQSPARGLAPQTEDGSLITVQLTGRRDASGRTALRVDQVWYTATYCTIPSYVVVPVAQALADPATPAELRPALQASLARTQAIQSRGVAQPLP
jgi:poly-gamma-glutamate synthesis protein (capsule biosynthesis protein)